MTDMSEIMQRVQADFDARSSSPKCPPCPVCGGKSLHYANCPDAGEEVYSLDATVLDLSKTISATGAARAD